MPATSFSSLLIAHSDIATGPSRTWGSTPAPASPPCTLPLSQQMLPQKIKPQMAQAWTGALHCSHDTLLVGCGSAGSRQRATRLFGLAAAAPHYGVLNA